MSMINRIVEAEMTVEESAELTHLEDEVSQAQDEVAFANEKFFAAREWQDIIDAGNELTEFSIIMERANVRLNKYMANVTIKVLARMKQFE